ncbi:NAD(P)-binding protein [Devosia sp. Root413D1]|uniref:NAD(P)-binding protein n=1 Tax=Devosia sp. Root413D1 TaxID=1736531 RepID=UPI000AAE4907|nr:NAD(P)-binding protein [Devosia sp. Root413D1]
MDAETLAPQSAPPLGVAIKTEIVVIGAGQAGLSSAYHLRQRGLAAGRGFVVLDQSPSAGGAWQFRWPSLTLSTVTGARPAGHGVLRGGRYQQRRGRSGGRRATLLRSL